MSRFLGFYDYTVILTYASLLSAVSSMFYASQGNYFYAVFFLMLSGLCDAFDGAVARSKKDRTEEGKAFGMAKTLAPHIPLPEEAYLGLAFD